MPTPEGRIKTKLNRELKKLPRVWKFMPVQASAFGMPALDYLLCVRGQFIAIETKAPGKNMTPRQIRTAQAIDRAGGLVLVVDNEASLQYALEWIRMTVA